MSLGPEYEVKETCPSKVCYSILWYIMVYYGILWYIMVYYGILWYIMVYHRILWYIMVYHRILWYIMVFYGVLWYGIVWYSMGSIWVQDLGFSNVRKLRANMQNPTHIKQNTKRKQGLWGCSGIFQDFGAQISDASCTSISLFRNFQGIFLAWHPGWKRLVWGLRLRVQDLR